MAGKTLIENLKDPDRLFWLENKDDLDFFQDAWKKILEKEDLAGNNRLLYRKTFL